MHLDHMTTCPNDLFGSRTFSRTPANLLIEVLSHEKGTQEGLQ